MADHLYRHRSLDPNKPLFFALTQVDADAMLRFGKTENISAPIRDRAVTPELVQSLKKVRQVVVVHGTNPKDRAIGEDLARRVGKIRCSRIVMGKETVSECVEVDVQWQEMEREPYEEPLIETYSDMLRKRRERLAAGEDDKVTIPDDGAMKGIASWLGVLLKGCVYFLLAYPKVGKTTFMVQLLWALSQKYRTCFYCFEMEPPHVAQYMLNPHIKQRPSHWFNEPMWDEVDKVVKASQWTFGKAGTHTTWRERGNAMEEYCQYHGTQVLCVDSFHQPILDCIENMTQAEAAWATELKNKAVRLNVPVIVVIHPTKENMDGKEERHPRYYDMRGSAAIGAVAQGVWVLHRPMLPKEPGDPSAERSSIGYIRRDVFRGMPCGEALYLVYEGDIATWKVATPDDISIYREREAKKRAPRAGSVSDKYRKGDTGGTNGKDKAAGKDSDE